MSDRASPGVATLLGMGVTAALCLGAGVGGGYWLDETLKTGLVLTFVGLILGTAAAVAAVYLEVKTFL